MHVSFLFSIGTLSASMLVVAASDSSQSDSDSQPLEGLGKSRTWTLPGGPYPPGLVWPTWTPTPTQAPQPEPITKTVTATLTEVPITTTVTAPPNGTDTTIITVTTTAAEPVPTTAPPPAPTGPPGLPICKWRRPYFCIGRKCWYMPDKTCLLPPELGEHDGFYEPEDLPEPPETPEPE